MCGIAGYISSNRINKVPAMLSAMSHRGPDGEGLWKNNKGNVSLGHKRLSIIDPEGGHQPLSNEDGSLWITFNGCIYNYMELSTVLRQKGHIFKTHSDTEVIVHAYEEWGEACLDRFIGMFSFAIWDDRKKRLFCARDRLGVKPFYYFSSAGRFFFASEIKALLASKEIRAEADATSLQDYITFQTTMGHRTLFKDIFKLLPGHYLTCSESGKVTVKQYWNLKFDVDEAHDEAYFSQRLRLLLEDSVKIRLRSDVPLGAHLSGGLDSSLISSLASTLMDLPGEKLNTFTGGFSEGTEYDETAYARRVATDINANYHEIRPSSKDFIDSFSKIIYFMDEPAAGPGVFPQFFVSKRASQNVKVVLGGQGGDELFIGYARYLIGYLEECLKGSIEESSERSHYAATLSNIIPSLPLLKQYVPMLQQFWSKGLFEAQDKRYFSLMDRSDAFRSIYTPEALDQTSRTFDEFSTIFNESNAKSFVNKMLYFDLKTHLPALLHVEDRTSMAWSLESRVPLLDHRIVELLSSVPPVIKFKNGHPKHLFRTAIHDMIPDEIMSRRDKMGFPVPLNIWYQSDLKGFVEEILLDRKAQQRGIFQAEALEKLIKNERSFGRAVWGALCLEMWFQQFIDHEGSTC